MTADLFCCERLQPDLAKAQRDPVIFADDRALQLLIHREMVADNDIRNYFEHVQTDIKPFMRQIVTTWMLEVCEELMCEDQVFPVSVSLLDRFLSCCKISKRQLQLLASVCMLLSSKVRQSQMISVKTLCYYTENSITPDDIKDWELLVVSKLDWHLNGVTAYDFLEHIFQKLIWTRGHPLLRRHAVSLVSVCCTDSDLLGVAPSIVAAACVCSAARGLRVEGSCRVLQELATFLPAVTTSASSELQRVIARVEASVLAAAAAPVSTHPALPMTPIQKQMIYNNNNKSDTNQPDTPTNVSHVYFY